MKKAILGIFCFTALTGFSQSNVVGTGGNASGSGGNLSYSIGQIDYINSEGSSGNVHQGVQQPFEFYSVSSGLNEQFLIDANLYPNPTNEYIILSLGDIQQDLRFELVDLNGKLLDKGDITSTQTTIDARFYAPGQYFLNILSLKQTVQSFKIVKN